MQELLDFASDIKKQVGDNFSSFIYTELSNYS